jgi:hypothetical protein
MHRQQLHIKKQIVCKLNTVLCFLLGNSPASEITDAGELPKRKQHLEHGESFKSRKLNTGLSDPITDFLLNV